MHKRRGSRFPVTFEKRDCDGSFAEKTDCCVNYILYASKTELEEKLEKERLSDCVSREIGRCGGTRYLSLIQLQKINEIISEGTKEEQASYDVEKVVEKLEKLKSKLCRKPTTVAVTIDGLSTIMDCVINIVKAGGSDV